MKKFIAGFSLLLTTALCGALPVRGQDATRDILTQPSMSQISYPEGKEAPKETPKETRAQAAEAKGPAAPAKPAAAPARPLPSDAALGRATKPEPSVDDYVVEILPPGDAQGEMLTILARGYASSPALRARREELRAQYENVVQAESYGRPNVAASAGLTHNWSRTTPGGRADFTARDVGLSATQYLYRGGRTLAEVERQLRLSDAAQAAYESDTQTAMVNIALAAIDIQRDAATIDLTEKNHEVIAKQLQSAQRGFDVGELTRTDVAQARARLSGAEADLVSARANLSSSLARFRQYAGFDGEGLSLSLEMPSLALPATLDEAQARAREANPDLRAARFAEAAAAEAVREAQGRLLPEISLNGALSKAWEPSSALDESRGASLGVRATMPLYEGGATRSLIRQARLGRYARKDQVEDAQRTVEKAVTQAWNDLAAARSAIGAYNKQVEAATLARDGVYKERQVGLRTVLDTLDADAELLDAQVGLVRARRDAVAAAFAVLAATGGLTGDALGLSGDDAHKGYLDEARRSYFSTAVSPLEAREARTAAGPDKR